MEVENVIERHANEQTYEHDVPIVRIDHRARSLCGRNNPHGEENNRQSLWHAGRPSRMIGDWLVPLRTYNRSPNHVTTTSAEAVRAPDPTNIDRARRMGNRVPVPDERLQKIMEQFGLEKKNLRKFWKTFRKFDKDKSGTIDLDEFYQMVKEKPSIFGDHIFELCDIDGSSGLDFSEFVSATVGLSHCVP